MWIQPVTNCDFEKPWAWSNSTSPTRRTKRGQRSMGEPWKRIWGLERLRKMTRGHRWNGKFLLALLRHCTQRCNTCFLALICMWTVPFVQLLTNSGSTCSLELEHRFRFWRSCKWWCITWPAQRLWLGNGTFQRHQITTMENTWKHCMLDVCSTIISWFYFVKRPNSHKWDVTSGPLSRWWPWRSMLASKPLQQLFRYSTALSQWYIKKQSTAFCVSKRFGASWFKEVWLCCHQLRI